MRRGSYILALAAVGALLICSPVSAQQYSQYHSGGQLDVGIFYDSLAPYGDWVEMPDYGWSFAPRVDRDWRPYTRGQWIMTDDGWFWDSDERFGWAAYHYGRWINDRYYGWVWVPGTEWAPAWVSWRHGNGYTGWAPLPPRATWQTHVGLSIGGLDIDAFIGSRDYAFVPDRAFVDRGVYQRVLPPTQNVTIINQTTNITNYTVVNQRVVNGGIAVANVERAVGRSVPRARAVDVDRFDAPKRARADEVAVFRPEVRVAPERRPAQGRSLVKGDEPPPLLVARRKEREQERQQKGNEPEVTAKDVQKQGPAGQQRDKEKTTAGQPQSPGTDAKAVQQETQRQRDQARQEADKRIANDKAQQQTDKKLALDQAQQDAAKQRAKDQDQVRLDREKRQAIDQQQRDQAQQDADKKIANAKAQQQADRKLALEQAQQDAAKQHAKDQDQQRLDREKRQAIDQQQRDQAQQDADKKIANAKAQQQADKKLALEQAQQDAAKQHAQDQDQQRLDREKHQADQQQRDAQAQADRHAKDAAQQGRDQKQNDQQQPDQQRAKPDADAQAQADKHAKDAQQQAKDNPKDDPKDKGTAKDKAKKKTKASPTPPPPDPQH